MSKPCGSSPAVRWRPRRYRCFAPVSQSNYGGRNLAMKRVISLVFVACAVAITSVIWHDKTEEDGGPFAGAEIHLMRHAEAVYIFSVKANSPETPNQKDLRRLGPEAQQALVDTLCN